MLYCSYGRGVTYGYKPVEQLVFSDDFMFGAVMSDSKICKGVLYLHCSCRSRVTT